MLNRQQQQVNNELRTKDLIIEKLRKEGIAHPNDGSEDDYRRIAEDSSR